MSAGVFAIVLLAALLHAVWNALVKSGADKTVAMLAVVLGQGLAGLAGMGVAPLPNPACWPWLLGGLILHLGYQTFLVAAYRLGDLTQVYPIARGVSPLLVAGGSALILGVAFTALELLAIAMIAIGIASISLVRRADGIFQGKAAALALVTGGFIASYSLNDGIGARVAGTALGFYGALAVLNALACAGLAAFWRPALITAALREARVLLVGGGASFTAYALVVHAFTLAPIALVTALRETSIVFALLIGVAFLGERLNLMKVVATAMTLAGAALLRLSKG
ncbi:hypothetical protein DDZ14_11550 [Maritimibacter sp. 55A14]|uniref:DMT family transporter n=1 Tax=Maritimibacter sp. 55A14 TaxID=2174844 RepID=UPI000D612D2F|nr:DMT family transporter [Maritimibacter sp. 55A14]PWE32083.1 hypothetical protein DDZ14_11550 [Maritimibacter sp. 55A14]